MCNLSRDLRLGIIRLKFQFTFLYTVIFRIPPCKKADAFPPAPALVNIMSILFDFVYFTTVRWRAVFRIEDYHLYLGKISPLSH